MKIKTVIFDFGDTLIPLDLKKMKEEFALLGAKEVDTLGDESSAFKKLWNSYDSGLDTASFRTSVREVLNLSEEITDEQIDKAWNALLGDLSDNHKQLIIQLKEKGIKCILLSNSNEIHHVSIRERFGDFLEKHFHQEYYSQIVKMAKPHPEIYQHVLSEHKLKAEETLFFDDKEVNILGARRVGIHAKQIKIDTVVTEVLEEIDRIERIRKPSAFQRFFKNAPQTTVHYGVNASNLGNHP